MLICWSECNFEDYEEDKKRRLGADAVEPKRIMYKKFVRERSLEQLDILIIGLLRDLEEQVYQRGYPERATIDQIVVFVENGELKFKGRFLDVVKQLDRDHWEFEGNEANSLVERLRAISAAFQLGGVDVHRV